MMLTLLQYHNDTVNGGTYYLGDYPENSIHEWSDVIRKNIRKGKAVVFSIKLMRLMAMTGDLLKKMGWTDSPTTIFRLNNMLTGFALSNRKNAVNCG